MPSGQASSGRDAKVVLALVTRTIPVNGPKNLLTAGTRIQQMTIVVVDVRNFTLLSERLSHEMLAVIMGKFFRDATAQIEQNRGVVDKFIGDAIMARWLADNDALLSTVTAALAAVQGIRGVTSALDREHCVLMDAFSVGCGINSGQAILGNVGAGGTREYTALGDSVNIAFRLETASKELKKDVVIGPDSYRLLPKRLWEDSLQMVSVKNKKDPISVWPVTFAELDKSLPLV